MKEHMNQVEILLMLLMQMGRQGWGLGVHLVNRYHVMPVCPVLNYTFSS